MKNAFFSSHIQSKIHAQHLRELFISLKRIIIVEPFPSIKRLLPTNVDHILVLEFKVEQLSRSTI